MRTTPRFGARWLARLVLLFAGLHVSSALGAVNCSVSSPGVSVTYAPLNSSDHSSSSTVTISCTRARSDSSSFNWSLAADFGLNSSGSTRQAMRVGATQLLSYQLFRDSAYTQVWGNSSTDHFTGTFSFSPGQTSGSSTITYYSRIPARQAVPAGEYRDIPTMTFYVNNVLHSTNTFGATFKVDNACSISSSPGTVQFRYTSFQPSAATARTSFSVTCLSETSYTMSLDATSGTVLGLTYSLAISPAGTQIGIGSPQPASISGTIAPGQAGRCSQGSCTDTQTRILTITY